MNLARALLLGCAAALAGCEGNDAELRCFRDLQRDACRARCRGGEERACVALQAIEARAGEPAAMRRACENGDMFACTDLAQRAPDPAEKRKILERACARGDDGAPACAQLADFIPDPVEKRALLERACAGPFGILACRRLADLEADPAARARRLADTCIGGLDEGCDRLVEAEPNAGARRALLVAACERAPFACRIHPIAWALEHAKVPVDRGDGGG